MDRIITALEVQKRNKDRVNIFLDGEFAFGLPLMEAAKLRKGQVLSEAEVTTLQMLDDESLAFDRAVRLLARRPYSTAEIRRNLESKETALPVIDAVLARLAQLGYLDDRAFALYWIENREQFKPRGARALQYELRQKGVPQDIIEDVLAEYDLHASAYRAAQDKVRRLRGSTLNDFRNKIGAFLARRGFGYDIVREVVDQLVHELQEEQPDYFGLDQTTDEE